MQVAVFGAGPAGLMAAWGVIQAGHTPVIYDAHPPKEPVVNNAGVFLLHKSLDLPLAAKECEIHVWGIGKLMPVEWKYLYRRKVYAQDRTGFDVSVPESRRTVAYFWDAHKALGLIWDMVAQFIHPEPVLASRVAVHDALSAGMRVISAVPLPVYYPDHPEWFGEVEVEVYSGTAPDDEAFIAYNVGEAMPWYRCSAMFGRFTMEYPSQAALPEPHNGKVRRVRKVTTSDIPEGKDWHNYLHPFIGVGRMGTWRKSELSHDAYYRTLEWLNHG